MPVIERLRTATISRDYRRLWLAQAFSSFGEYLFASTAVVWVATTLFANSARLPALVGVVVLAGSVPRIVVGPIGGVCADRWHARKTMIVNDCLRAGVFVVLLAAVEFGRLNSSRMFAVIIVCLVISEICAQFFNPSRAAVMQLVIPADRRVEAASMAMFSLTGVAIAATALGPVLFGLVGAQVAVGVCVLTYGASCVMTCQIPDRYRPKQELVGRFWRDLATGLHVTWRTPILRTVLFGVCLYSVSLGINNSVLALFAMKTLHLNSSRYGLLAMMFPIGNLVSAAFGVRIIKRVGLHRAYLMALTILGFGYFAYAASRQLPVACALMLICGMVFSIYVMCQGPILHEAAPEGYVGRISAISGPTTAITSAASTLVASQALAIAAARGAVAGSGDWVDPYRLAIMFGAAFLLVGGAAMYIAQSRLHRAADA